MPFEYLFWRSAVLRTFVSWLAVGFLTVAVGADGFHAAGVPAPMHKVLIADPDPAHRPAAGFDVAEAAVPIQLSAATSQPAPAQVTTPLADHEVWGFAPYWFLGGGSSSYDFSGFTTIVYFGVDVNGDGSADHTSNGWIGYQSQDLVDLINKVHAAGGRVVLTAKNFDDVALRQLSTDPNAQKQLTATLIQLVQDKSMDGVNFDFEGTGGDDRAAFVSMIAGQSAALRQANPKWQISIDTYASSATDAGGFFDVVGLAPSVDAVFVMAYDMQHESQASPTAPLADYAPNDQQVIFNYQNTIAPSKVILGIPFYGYEWPTTDGGAKATTTGAHTARTVADFMGSGQPQYWDSSADVPWTSYQDTAGGWREGFFENPASVAMKAQAAGSAGLRGVGAWALGFEGNNAAFKNALHGQSAGGHGSAGPAHGAGQTPSPSPSASPTPSPSGAPSPSPSPQPTPSPSPNPVPSPQPLPSPSPVPSPTPVPSPKPLPSVLPSLP